MGLFSLPNFARRRAKLEPVRFVPVVNVFKPQREVKMLRDVNGWAGRKEDRRKWHLAAGQVIAIDEDKAREFILKGYAEPVGWHFRASEDERAEALSSVTTITMGA